MRSLWCKFTITLFNEVCTLITLRHKPVLSTNNATQYYYLNKVQNKIFFCPIISEVLHVWTLIRVTWHLNPFPLTTILFCLEHPPDWEYWRLKDSCRTHSTHQRGIMDCYVRGRNHHSQLLLFGPLRNHVAIGSFAPCALHALPYRWSTYSIDKSPNQPPIISIIYT